MSTETHKQPKLTPGKCDHDMCICEGKGNLELNGLRFVCRGRKGANQVTLECHADDFPAFYLLGDLLEVLKENFDRMERRYIESELRGEPYRRMANRDPLYLRTRKVLLKAGYHLTRRKAK